jgi:polyisoprenoid-binding protein YceI
MTGAKSMEIVGTLTLHGVTRPMVVVATYNGGYAAGRRTLIESASPK